MRQNCLNFLHIFIIILTISQIAVSFKKCVCNHKQSTHIDRGHIHNHIIFNDVNFVDYKHSHINKKWYYETRKVSDRLCDEYGLSVIPPNASKGKSYLEHQAAKQGMSYKAQLKADIDRAIRKSLDYTDFLLRMEIAGYEVKQGKYILFKAKDRERFIRGKTLGGYYAEDSIKEHNPPPEKREPPYQSYHRHSKLDHGTGKQGLS